MDEKTEKIIDNLWEVKKVEPVQIQWGTNSYQALGHYEAEKRAFIDKWGSGAGNNWQAEQLWNTRYPRGVRDWFNIPVDELDMLVGKVNELVSVINRLQRHG